MTAFKLLLHVLLALSSFGDVCVLKGASELLVQSQGLLSGKNHGGYPLSGGFYLFKLYFKSPPVVEVFVLEISEISELN